MLILILHEGGTVTGEALVGGHREAERQSEADLEAKKIAGVFEATAVRIFSIGMSSSVSQLELA